MVKEFNNIYIKYLPPQQNTNIDALTSLVASLALSAGVSEKTLVFNPDLYCSSPLTEREQTLTKVFYDQEVLATSLDPVQKDWQFPFNDFCLYGILPDDPQEATSI